MHTVTILAQMAKHRFKYFKHDQPTLCTPAFCQLCAMPRDLDFDINLDADAEEEDAADDSAQSGDDAEESNEDDASPCKK